MQTQQSERACTYYTSGVPQSVLPASVSYMHAESVHTTVCFSQSLVVGYLVGDIK